MVAPPTPIPVTPPPAQEADGHWFDVGALVDLIAAVIDRNTPEPERRDAGSFGGGW